MIWAAQEKIPVPEERDPRKQGSKPDWMAAKEAEHKIPRSVIHENKDRNSPGGCCRRGPGPEERDPRKQGSKLLHRVGNHPQHRHPEERDPRKQGSKRQDLERVLAAKRPRGA